MPAPTIDVLSPARSRMLVPLATVKSELGITDSSQDAKLTRQILAVGRLVESSEFLDRPPWRQRYRVTMASSGSLELWLPRYPVETIESITEDGAALASSAYSVSGESRSRVYRTDGWPSSARSLSPLFFRDAAPDSEERTIVVTLSAGWLMPGQAVAWSAVVVKAVGDFVKPTAWLEGDLYFECTTAGTTGASQPTWTTTVGSTVTDGSVTWTARAATELPEDIQEAALAAVTRIYEGVASQGGEISSEDDGTARIQYAVSSSAGVQIIPPAAASLLRAYA